MKWNVIVHKFDTTAKQQELVKNSLSISNFISDKWQQVKGVEEEVRKVNIFCTSVNNKLPYNHLTKGYIISTMDEK